MKNLFLRNQVVAAATSAFLAGYILFSPFALFLLLTLFTFSPFSLFFTFSHFPSTRRRVRPFCVFSFALQFSYFALLTPLVITVILV